MKPWEYVIVLVLAFACLGMGISVVTLSQSNASLQRQWQNQQNQLNGGILGQRGQQVAATILQEMANASARNPKLRTLLTNHGYSVQPPDAAPEGGDRKPAAAPAAPERSGS